jgi:hypothetical protein
MGLKVLGLDRAYNAGVLGSGSTGNGRIWRHLHSEERYFNMMMEALEIWRDIEKETG